MKSEKYPNIKNKEFKYSITYAITTPESLENGDYEEQGFEVEPEESPIGDILRSAHFTYGIYSPIAIGRWESTEPVSDRNHFEKGESKYFTLHLTNADGTEITEEEHEFITYLLSNGEYDLSDYEDFGFGGSVNTGRSWKLDRAKHNKRENYEVPMSARKHEGGGQIKIGDEVKYNGYQYFVESILDNETFVLSNPEKFGNVKEYRTIEEIEKLSGGGGVGGEYFAKGGHVHMNYYTTRIDFKKEGKNQTEHIGVLCENEKDAVEKAVDKLKSEQGKGIEIVKARLVRDGEKWNNGGVLEKYLGGGNVSTSDKRFVLEVRDGKTNELLEEKVYRANRYSTAKSDAEDDEEMFHKKYGDYLNFNLTEKYADGGGVEKSYNNPENDTHVLNIDGYNWYLEKIDSTHFYMSNSPNLRGMAHHLGQHRGEPYYDEIKQWLKETKYANGGSISEKANLTNRISNLKRLLPTLNEDEKEDMKMMIQDLESKLEKYAKGGLTEHGLRVGDKVVFEHLVDENINVVDSKGEKHIVDLDEGKRYEGGGGVGDYAINKEGKGKNSTYSVDFENRSTIYTRIENGQLVSTGNLPEKILNELLKKYEKDGHKIWYGLDGKPVSSYEGGGQIQFRDLSNSKNFDVITPNGRFEIEVDKKDGSPKYAIKSGDDHRLPVSREELKDYQDEIFQYAMRSSYEGGGGVSDWMEQALEDLRKESGYDDLEIENSNDNSFSATNGSVDYLVCENDDVAEEMAINRVKEDLEENPEYFTRDWLMNYIDGGDFFENVYKQWNMGYATDIMTEDDDEYGNRLIREMVDFGIMDSDEATSEESEEIMNDRIDEFVQLMTNDQLGSDKGVQYYIDNFGEEEAFKIIVENNLIDVEEASKDAVNVDGIGHFLSSYDGEMVYLENGSVAFRNN